jgi:hypothetical protein
MEVGETVRRDANVSMVRKEKSDALVEEAFTLVLAEQAQPVADAEEQQRGKEWEQYICGVYRTHIYPHLVKEICDVLESVRNELSAEFRGVLSQTSRTGARGERGPPGYLPSVLPWRRGSVAYAGMVCHHRGSSFQARVDTAAEPSARSRDWQALALAGKSGLQERIEIERSLIERQRAEISRLEARIEALERKAPCKCQGAS